MSETMQKCPNCSESVPLEYSVCPFCGFGLLEYELKRFSYKPKIREVISRLISFYRRPFKTSNELGVATENRASNLLLYLFSLFLSLRLYFTILKANFNFGGIGIGSKASDPTQPFMTISFGLILFFVNLLILPFFIWVLYILLFRFGSWIITKFSGILGADVKSPQLRTILGYSIAPVVAGEFIGILFTLINPGGNPSASNFDSILSFVENFYNSAVMIIFKFLMLIMWIITLAYATIGLRVVGKMAWINAALALAIPLGIYVWFFYLTGMFG